jgi:hypothetical protein
VTLIAKGLAEQPQAVEDLKMDDDALYDAARGAGLGTMVGVLSGLGVAITAGALVFLIGGGIVGSLVGGFVGAMAGMGVHEHRIKHYERLVAKGNVLVIAHGNPLELAEAHRLLQETSARELHTYVQADEEAAESAQT